jgi:hypothetical protein
MGARVIGIKLYGTAEGNGVYRYQERIRARKGISPS